MPYKDPNSPAARANLAKRTKKWREAHPEKWAAISKRTSRTRYYKHMHGITEAEFESQIETQHGLCPIGNHPFGPRGKTAGAPCQDHNHTTGENRLILCREHNVGLGCFKDSVPELEAAILYLKSFEKQTGELPCQTHPQFVGKSQERSN
jgi:hypothetical protein